MTKEEKAIESAKKYACKGCIKKCKQIDLLCGGARYYINAFKDGYDQGKADCLAKDKKNEREWQCGKGHIESLKRRTTELEKQIEKMKCCENCALYDGTDCDSNYENDCKFFHNGGKDDYWQLKEE